MSWGTDAIAIRKFGLSFRGPLQAYGKPSENIHIDVRFISLTVVKVIWAVHSPNPLSYMGNIKT